MSDPNAPETPHNEPASGDAAVPGTTPPAEPIAPPAYAPPPAYTPPAYQPPAAPVDAPPAYQPQAAPIDTPAPAYPAPSDYGVSASAPPYTQPGYPASPAYSGYAAPAGGTTNTLAIVALISGIAGLTLVPFIGSIVGIITGHISLGQIKRTGENGRGMALAGVITGWVGAALTLIAIIFFFVILGAIAASSTRF